MTSKLNIKTDENRVRRKAARHGYRVHKSRRQFCLDNLGEYMLVDKAWNLPVMGSSYSATLDEIEAFIDEA